MDTDTSTADEYYTVREVAQLLEASERTIRAHARELGGRRPLNGRAWQIPRATLAQRAAQAGFKVPAHLEVKDVE